eukprot:scaffold1864_cov106-Isochrysis_galbana.AAC.15
MSNLANSSGRDIPTRVGGPPPICRSAMRSAPLRGSRESGPPSRRPRQKSTTRAAGRRQAIATRRVSAPTVSFGDGSNSRVQLGSRIWMDISGPPALGRWRPATAQVHLTSAACRSTAAG